MQGVLRMFGLGWGHWGIESRSIHLARRVKADVSVSVSVSVSVDFRVMCHC